MMNFSTRARVNAVVIGVLLSVACGSSGPGGCGGNASAGNTGSATPTTSTIVASCTANEGPYCSDYNGKVWTTEKTKASCASGTWSASPCPTAEQSRFVRDTNRSGGRRFFYARQHLPRSNELLLQYVPLGQRLRKLFRARWPPEPSSPVRERVLRRSPNDAGRCYRVSMCHSR